MRLVDLLLPHDNTGSEARLKVAKVCKFVLRVLCWAVSLWWMVLWLVYPTTPGSSFKQDVSTHVVSSFFGTSGTYFNSSSSMTVCLQNSVSNSISILLQFHEVSQLGIGFLLSMNSRRRDS